MLFLHVYLWLLYNLAGFQSNNKKIKGKIPVNFAGFRGQTSIFVSTHATIWRIPIVNDCLCDKQICKNGFFSKETFWHENCFFFNFYKMQGRSFPRFSKMQASFTEFSMHGPWFFCFYQKLACISFMCISFMCLQYFIITLNKFDAFLLSLLK